MATEKNPNWGGAREGGGRPKGSGNKITAKELLETCEKVIGKSFAISLLEGYRDSIVVGDTKLRHTYEKIILDKTASTLFEGEITDPSDDAKLKQTAFIEALTALSEINKKSKE